MFLRSVIDSCLNRPSSSRARRTASQKGRFRPSCERLEDRCVPTGLSIPAAHTYDFNGSLADEQGGPAIVSDGGTLQGGRYVFGKNQGLLLSGALADTSTYSVVARLSLDALTPTFKKLLDFNGGKTDPGLYVAGTRLQLYPFGVGTTDVSAGTDFLLTLTQDGSKGETKVYFNNVLQQTYTGNVAVPTSNLLIFFEDDGKGGEAVGGSVDYIATFNGVLTLQDVTTLASSALGVTVNQNQVTVTEGQTAFNSGAWGDNGIEPVTLKATSGSVVKNSDGTWSWSFATSDGPDDSRSVTITATDTDGASQSVSFALNVNNAAPSVTASAGSVTVAEGGTASMTGTWSDPGADVVTLMASVGSIVKNSNGTWSWSFATSDGPDDSQTVNVTATDSDGASRSVSFSLVVTNVAPSVTVGASSVTATEGDVASVSGAWYDVGGDFVTLNVSLGSIVKHADGTWLWSYHTANGSGNSQTVTVTGTDSDGDSNSVSFSLTVNNAPPTGTSNSGSVTVAEGSPASMTGTWSDPVLYDGVTLAASVGSIIQNADGTWSWSFVPADGPDNSQTVIITATDSDGASSTASFSLIVNNVAPSIASSAGSVTVAEGSAASKTGTWSDPGADVVTLSASVGSVVRNANGTWSWSFVPADGPDNSQTVIITATDSDGASSTASFSLIVNNVAPSVASSSVLISVPAGSTATMTGTWSDPGADVVTLATSVGTVVKNSNGTWTWSYVNASSSQTVVVTATDSDGASSTTSFNMTVTSTAGLQLTQLTSSNPSLTQPAADGNVKIDGTFANASGQAKVKVSWGDGSKAESLSVDQLAHAFKGSHHYSSGGVFTVTVTLTDAKGATVTKTTTAVVRGVGVVDGVLYVVGSQRADEISIERVKGGLRGREEFYRVEVRFGEGFGNRTEVYLLRANQVDRIAVVAGTNDRVRLGKGVTADVVTVAANNESHHCHDGHFAHTFGEALRNLLHWLEALRHR